MKTTTMFAMAASLFLASAAHSAETIKPANVNVIALPAVQKPVIDSKPAIAPILAPTIEPRETTRRSGEVKPAAFDEKAMTVRTFTPATISPRDPAQPPQTVDKGGVAKPGLPDGPMLSPLDDSRKSKPKGGEKLDKAALDKQVKQLQDKKDSLGELSQEDTKLLQLLMEKRARMSEAIGHTMEKTQDGNTPIVKNLK